MRNNSKVWLCQFPRISTTENGTDYLLGLNTGLTFFRRSIKVNYAGLYRIFSPKWRFFCFQAEAALITAFAKIHLTVR